MKFFIAIVATFLIPAVQASESNKADAYKIETETWRSERQESLKAPYSWLSLVGLHWLNEGRTSFGSESSHSIILPKRLPKTAGHIIYDEESGVFIEPAPGVKIITKNGVVTTRTALNLERQSNQMEIDDVKILLIKRGNRVGLRVQDPQAANRKQFKGLEWFPIDRDYQVEATLIPSEKEKFVAVPNVLGDTIEWQSPGKLKFLLDGKEHKVTALQSAESLFIIFKDTTSGSETYPAGRFLYAELPKDGKTTLDFNRAYNPPCAFTAYATCPLPPRENWLKAAIHAGERYTQKTKAH